MVSKKDEQTAEHLRKMVTLFILRRRKQEVLKELSDKIEKDILVKMGTEKVICRPYEKVQTGARKSER